jgi:hypothetical protein
MSDPANSPYETLPLARRPTSDALAPTLPAPAPPAAPLALAGDLPAQVRLVRDLTAARPGTVARRALFMWLRIFVDEQKPGGKRERVNIRVPLPLPFIGLLLPYKISSSTALAALAEAHAASDGPTALQRALDAHMPFEFVHVEETNDRTGKQSLVVIGLE